MIRDGKVLPENEGKVVIVTDILKAPMPFVDEKTGIPLNSVVAYRQVEKLVIEEGKKEGDKKDPDTWKWEFAALEKYFFTYNLPTSSPKLSSINDTARFQRGFGYF